MCAKAAHWGSCSIPPIPSIQGHFLHTLPLCPAAQSKHFLPLLSEVMGGGGRGGGLTDSLKLQFGHMNLKTFANASLDPVVYSLPFCDLTSLP